MAAAIYALRDALPNPNEGVTLLYVLPIALVAVRFGAGAGILAAVVAIGLFAVWEQSNDDVSIGLLGYMTRATAFLVLGGLLGQFAAQRDSLVRELRELSRTDQLTGVRNHATFYAELSRELALARRYGRCGTLMVADLDGFKEVNDTHGHAVGDEILKDAANALCRTLRDTDIVGRVGGDEFAALLPGTGREAANVAALRFAELLDSSERKGPGGAVRVGVSVGLTTFDGSGDLSAKQAFAAADRAMYEAKQNRRSPSPRR